MERGRPVLALGCQVGAVLDEEPGQIHLTLKGRPMQRGRPVLALGCHVGAVLDEEPGHIHKTPFERLIRLVITLVCRVSTGLDGELSKNHFGCPMQRCYTVLALGRHVGTVLDEEPGHIRMTM